ncbi:TonB-dependent receptor plug domain-containing protein [Polaribacter sp. Hel1_85]|uniref:TonB-dependent receptor plug domain-containing protein n=1 Tax=Polaribacter sp. Hel1_85 TaxID=1250005 RepID=UPI00052C4D8D|nr:TonB-dependent receptor [Polaribacter sp. Hel1_85]KGL63559.1 TonB-dependent receptor, plug [Polaribacter sp. Hel1_85]
MKKQFLIVGVLACSFVSTNLFAQKKEKQKEKVETLKEVVITATKFKLKKENTGKVIHKITQKELQQNAGKNVIEILNTVAGIDVRGVNANVSEPRSINIRGGRSRQVLVLIDGVPVTDQSAINQEFDLRLLSLSQIESIEILKGASSTLYGSGAANAVINIVLKKASEDKISGSFETSFGTNNTASVTGSGLSDKNQNVALNGTLGNFNFLSSFSITGIDGMSSAKSKTNTAFEEDSFYSKNALVKLGYKVNSQVSVETFLNYDEFDYDFDTGAFSDSDVNTGDQNQFRFGIKPSFNYEKGKLYVLASVNEVKRNINQFNSYGGTLDNYQFKGRSVNVDLVNKYEFSSKIQVITGLNYQEHSNQTETPFATIDKDVANFNTIDPYASVVYISDYGLSANVGGRLNIHNVYGNHMVYDGNLAYSVLKDENASVKLLTSYSTAFIAPSLYQLYDGFAGNIDLKPESNKTFEAGFDVNYQDWIQLDAVYFSRKEEDAIIYDNTTYKYGNGSSDANGFEVNTKITPVSFLTLNASYTYVDKDQTEDFNDYIPANKIVAGVDITALDNAFFNLTYRNVGDRTIFDRWGSFGTAGVDVILPSYQVLDFTANYKLLDETVTFFGAVTNILDEDYDDVLGFSTRGRNFKVGVSLQF